MPKLHTLSTFLTVVLLFILSGAVGQTTLSTIYTNSPNVNVLLVEPSYVTFQVKNDNSYPIAITGIGNQHIAAATLTAGPVSINYSQNYGRYALWYNENSNATAPIDPSNGWVFADTSAIITTSANGIVQVMSGIKDLIIPPNTTYRFILATNDSISAVGNATTIPVPGTFSTDNVTLITGGLPWGQYPGGSQVNGQAFNGNIVFQRGLPKPAITATPAKAHYCLGDPVTLVAKAEGYINNPTFTWRFKGNIVGTGDTYTLPGGVTQSTAGVYSCVVSDGTVSSNEAEYQVTYSDPPAPTISGKLDYCLNEPFEYTVVNGNNPVWYYTPTGGSPVPVIPTINTSSPNSLVYYVAQTDKHGCESSKRTLVRYRVAPKPEKPIVSTPLYYCEEMQSDPLTAVGETLRWYYAPVGGVPTADAPLPNTSKDDSFQYYVTQNIDGCESDRARIDVVVTFRPNGKILTDKETICEGDSIVLDYYGSAFVGSQYNWTMPAGTTILNGGFDRGPIAIRLDAPGTHQVKLKVGHSSCMSEEYNQTLTVKARPDGKIIAKKDVCPGQPELIEMVNYTTTTDVFDWNFDGGKTTSVTTEQGPYNVYWETPGEKTISVIFADEGCATEVTETVIVHPRPDATITATYDVVDGQMTVTRDYMEGDEICASDSLKVTVQVVEPGAAYKWSPEKLFSSLGDQPVAYLRADFNTTVHVEVEDIYGCRNEGTLDIATKPCCEMTFPTAFTPNADGRNDLFRPITVGRREVKTFQVFNRYGQLVYETKQGHRGWDGTMNGRSAEIGTYFYMIQFVCGSENLTQSGEVVLVR